MMKKEQLSEKGADSNENEIDRLSEEVLALNDALEVAMEGLSTAEKQSIKNPIDILAMKVMASGENSEEEFLRLIEMMQGTIAFLKHKKGSIQ
jgi:hypothetical protein